MISYRSALVLWILGYPALAVAGHVNNSAQQTEPITTMSPFFDINEWTSHLTGVEQEGYFLQNQIYHVAIELVAIPTTREKVPAYLKLHDQSGRLLVQSNIEIKLRGYTSLNFAKKQYGISIVDSNGKDMSLPLLDMPAAEDWVLSAPFNDKSLLRDILTYNLSNKMGRHAPRTRIVSLSFKVFGQETEKMGIYVLTEKNDFGKGRIDIPKKNAMGTSFLAVFDHPQDDDNVVWSGRETDLVLDYPSVEKITPEQSAEFMGIFSDIESRLSQAEGPRWNRIFDERLDLSSAVDFFIMQELARNIDGFRLSSPFYIPPKGKVYFGPLWDFNIAYGNAQHENGVQFTGWRSLEKGVWFQELFYHPIFCRAIKARWADARRDGTLSNNTIFHIIDTQAAVMAPLVDENFAKWPGLGVYLWPNPYWLATWDEEKNALKAWISLRNEWLDEAYSQLTCDDLSPQQAQLGEDQTSRFR